MATMKATCGNVAMVGGKRAAAAEWAPDRTGFFFFSFLEKDNTTGEELGSDNPLIITANFPLSVPKLVVKEVLEPTVYCCSVVVSHGMQWLNGSQNLM